jgi:hypothetical protein
LLKRGLLVAAVVALLAMVTTKPASGLSHDQNHLYDDNGNQITEYTYDGNGNIKVIKTVKPTSPETAGCQSYDMDTHECNGWYYVPGNDNHVSGDSHHGNNHNNHKSDSKFNVKVWVHGNGDYRLRVIVYGIHTLNKPTLDKPGVNVHADGDKFAGKFGFTAWKVPIGSKVKACVVDTDTRDKSCGYGENTRKNGPERIDIFTDKVRFDPLVINDTNNNN